MEAYWRSNAPTPFNFGRYKMIRKLKNKPHCPHCKATLDGYTHMGEGQLAPSVGDVTVCNKCAELLEFDEDIQLIPITSEAIDHIDLREIQKAQTVARMMIDFKASR